MAIPIGSNVADWGTFLAVLDQIPSYVFALASSMMFALGDQFQALGLQSMGRRSGATIGIAASAVCFWLLMPWFLDISNFAHPAVLWFILIGLIRPALSANLAIVAIHHLGPTLAGTLSGISPLFGAAPCRSYRGTSERHCR